MIIVPVITRRQIFRRMHYSGTPTNWSRIHNRQLAFALLSSNDLSSVSSLSLQQHWSLYGSYNKRQVPGTCMGNTWAHHKYRKANSMRLIVTPHHQTKTLDIWLVLLFWSFFMTKDGRPAENEELENQFLLPVDFSSLPILPVQMGRAIAR